MVEFNRSAYNVVKELIAKGETFEGAPMARKLQIPYTSFMRYVVRAKKELGVKSSKVAAATAKKKSGRAAGRGRDITQFQTIYDDNVKIPQLIEEGIEKHLRTADGTPAWLYDKEFREACGVPVSRWRRYADDYKHLQANARGDIVWAHPDIIQNIREMLLR